MLVKLKNSVCVSRGDDITLVIGAGQYVEKVSELVGLCDLETIPGTQVIVKDKHGAEVFVGTAVKDKEISFVARKEDIDELLCVRVNGQLMLV